MTELLRITNLQVQAFSNDQWITIVKNINAKLERGEVLGLIGESGAGKSTIGLAAMAYARMGCRICGGSIVFDGTELLGQSQELLRKIRGKRIAYVAQSAAASFNPAHRLIKQYAEAAVQHKLMSHAEAKKKAIGMYRRLLLPDPECIGYRYPHEVSGGQLQRAMVAMAMACTPDLIIFDEPTTALDVTTQIEVLAAIKKITSELNTAVIYITHDLAVVAQLAHHIMVLRYGELVEENSTRQILGDPEKDYTRALLSVRELHEDKDRPSSEKNILLEVENVSASYSQRENDAVLKDINLRIRRGQTVALVGESGSGKSTLARVITGLLPSLTGRVSYEGSVLPSALRNRPREILRQVQMIYQMPDTALNPKHKIRLLLGRPLFFYFGMKTKAREKRIYELLDQIGLPRKYIDRYPNELSGGEKQRICIARCLAAKPTLIVCDEPTSALDQLVAEGILKLLQALQKELRVSYLFITHDLATVKAICDEIIVMFKGSIVEQGLKKDVLTAPQHQYTQLLLSSIPKLDPDWLDNVLDQRKRNGIEMKGLAQPQN